MEGTVLLYWEVKVEMGVVSQILKMDMVSVLSKSKAPSHVLAHMN